MTKKDNDKTPKNYNLRRRKNKKYKTNDDSSDSDDSDWEPGCDEMMEEDEVERALEFQKFLQNLFPSKNQSEKIRQLKNIKKMLKNDSECSDDEKTNKKKTKNKKNCKKKKNKGKNKSLKKRVKNKKINADDLEEEVEEEIEATEDENDDEPMTYINEDGEEVEMDPQNMKFNIVFTVSDKNQGIYDFYDEEDLDSEEEWDREFEKAMMIEDKRMQEEERMKKEEDKKLKKNAKVHIKLDDWKNSHVGKIVKVYKGRKYFDVLLDDKDLNKRRWKKVHRKFLSVMEETEELKDTLDELRELMNTSKSKGKKAMMKKFENLSETYEKKMKEKKDKEEKKLKNKNSADFRKLLREKSVSNDFTHFKKLELVEQNNIIEKLKEIKEHTTIEKPYRLSLIESDIPVEFKDKALKKINMLNYMDPSSGEYYKVKQWVDTFMRIPFNKIKNLPITMDTGIEKCNAFMEDAKKTLDEAVYGLDDAKMQIMQMIGQWIANPTSVGSAIAIVGPPGTGKTTLVKEGISKILQRPFSFLALGGATDSSFLEGHSYTYEGSCWGKVVDILIQSKHMNPVIYFDELDKISKTPKGDEITGILTHLTDTSQNDKFHDKYFSSIDFDLSKCLFIFSYNEEDKVNPILKDRMYRITTKGYDKKEKTVIARKHLIPKIYKNVKFEEDQIIIPDETIHHLVDQMTDGEKGVRNLKRCLEIIYTKLNLFRLMKPDSEIFEKEKALKMEYPFTVSVDIVKKLIKKISSNGPPFGMYI